MKWFHRHRWTVTGVTRINRYNVHAPALPPWPATEILQLCACGDCRVKTLDGIWSLDQLQPLTSSDKETMKRMGIKL